MTKSRSLRIFFKGSLFLIGLVLIGCAQYTKNARLAEYAPEEGYRFNRLASGTNTDSLFVVLTFSGGGTRAAALSYGVLKALSETEITWKGEKKRLLDEVDLISTISGGSFTGAYYALFGGRIFSDFEARFLKRDIEKELRRLLYNPVTLLRLASPYFDRIDLAAEFYHRTVFDRKTFGDLVVHRRPFLVVNATNMFLGERFEFTQDQFDLLGSDLSSYPIARAVAASSAFPILLSPITLNNHPQPPDYERPDWIEDALEDYNRNRRRYLRARNFLIYADKDDHPYIHLLDGGLADNIGLRAVIDSMRDDAREGGILQLTNLKKIEKLVVIVVNAKTAPPENIDKKKRAPGIADVAMKTATVAMDNYSFETVELIKELKARREQIERTVRDCQALLNDRCAVAPTVPALKEIKYHIVEVAFEAIPDSKEQEEFLSLPTNFSLKPSVVDRVIEKGGALLHQSSAFNDFMEEIRSAGAE